MITVIFSTREPNPTHIEHIKKSSGLHNKIEVLEFINNSDSNSKYFNGGESLTKIYNRGLKQAKNNIVVFCHDDLTIETKQWGHKLLKQFEKNPEYGIIGVAGTKNMPSSGQWWENRKKMYGRVAHTHQGKTWLSTYSEDQDRDLEEVIIVDGVFFAIDKTKTKVEFNETVEGFHFYDITFCFENYLKGVKVGVSTVIRVNHKSIGMTNDAWEANRVAFAEKFKDNLPVQIKKVLRKGQRLKVLLSSLSITGKLEQNEYLYNIIKNLKNENCDITVASNFDESSTRQLKNMGIKVFTLKEPPGFKLGDGKWSLNTTEGLIPSQENILYKVSDANFDILHLNHKAVADHLLRLYPDTDTICTIHSTDKTKDEPVINPQVRKYLAIDNEVKDVLVDGYGIDESLVELSGNDNIVDTYKLILS